MGSVGETLKAEDKNFGKEGHRIKENAANRENLISKRPAAAAW